MSYPKVVKEKIKFLDNYKENLLLQEFDIFHIYPGKLAYPNGYYDSRFFKLIGFNTKTMEKRCLGKHDGLDFWEECSGVSIVRVFCDGAFLIRMRHLVKMIGNTQAPSFTRP